MTFTVKEQVVAESLLPGPKMRNRIAEVRDTLLVAGQDFVKKGKDVLYSAGGVERLADLLRGEAMPKKDAADEKRAAIEAAMEELPRARVKVTRVFATNTKFLHAEMVGVTTNTSVTVRVRENKNFMPGMEMDVLRGVGGVWDYVGYLPRARGRW
jgi:hypothetical protein